MTDKQKEAIETLFHLEHINGYVDLCEKHDVIIKSDILLKWKNATKEVLNLIQTQQTEIEERRNTKDLYYENKELRKLLKKKDKQIEYMANFINDNTPYTKDTRILENERGVRNTKYTEQFFERKSENGN